MALSSMTTRQKLEIIQKMLGLSQTALAARFGVSFVAFNAWWNGRAAPRPRMQKAIDGLFLEATGQKSIPASELAAKKAVLHQKTQAHKNIIEEILSSPDIRDQLYLKLTYHSNGIEGSTLTEPDTAAILFDGATIPGKSLNEHLEAKNHQTALGYLLDHLSNNGRIDTALALKLHGILMNSIRSDAGSFRCHAVRIAGISLVTANHLKIPDLIPPLMKTAAKKTKDPVNLAARTHADFERIHPFSDGNGRIGRLLMNAMLLKANLAPAVIRQEIKKFYYIHLHKAQTKNDPSQLEDFICDAILGGFDILERK